MFRYSFLMAFLSLFLIVNAQQKKEIVPWRINEDGHMQEHDTSLVKLYKIKSIRVINSYDKSIKAFMEFRSDYKINQTLYNSLSRYFYDDSGRLTTVIDIPDYLNPNPLSRDSIITNKTYLNKNVKREIYTTFKSGYTLNLQNRDINRRFYGKNFLHHYTHLRRYRRLHRRLKINYTDSNYYKVQTSGYWVDSISNYHSFKSFTIDKRKDRILAKASKNKNDNTFYGCGTSHYINSVTRSETKITQCYSNGLAQAVGTRSYRTDEPNKEKPTYYPAYIYEYTFF